MIGRKLITQHYKRWNDRYLDKDKLCAAGDKETLVELYTQNVIQLCSSGKLSKDPLFRKKFDKYLQGKK